LHIANKHFLGANKEHEGDYSRTMNNALFHSMDRTLKSNSASVGRDVDVFNSFRRLANSLSPDSVAMSGSIVVQAVLGDQWDGSDIDVYCTQGAAPAVRTWLINDLNQVLVGVHASYRTGERGSTVHHVEHWANEPKVGKTFECQCARGHVKWQFDKAASNHASPMYLQGRDLYDSDEVIDGDLHPSCAVHTEGDHTPIPFEPHTPIPFEPRLVDQCDENGRRKSKKETVNIDLIVVDSESSVADAIEDFDIVICKCSWDGIKFSIPTPTDTFERRSKLSDHHKSRMTHVYSKCVETEAGRAFRLVMSELRTGHRQPRPPNNFWLRRDGAMRNSNFLVLTGIAEDPKAASELELVVDHFGVFAERLDDELPHPVLWLIKTLRAVLVENALTDAEIISVCETTSRCTLGRRQQFLGLFLTCNNNPASVISSDDWKDGISSLIRRHNSFVKQVDRIKKYRARGIDIDSTVHLPSCCPALRELDVCPESWKDFPPELAEQLTRFPLKSPFLYRLAALVSADDDDDSSTESLVVFQEHEMRALAREEARWDAYRALVDEARHAAWAASIRALPPMGIALPSDASLSLQPSPSSASMMKPIGSNDSKEADPLKTVATTAKRPKTIYTNDMFTDSNGNPIPYCDNDDPPDPDDGKRILNDEIERDFGQWLNKREAAWRGNRRRRDEEEEVPIHSRKMPPESLVVTDTRFGSEGGGTKGHFSQSAGDKTRKKQKPL
jgi:hypothetical protein